jgi:deoxyribodipyrimidine photolyase-related protein
MTIGIWILGDQLDPEQTALQTHRANQAQPPLLLIESRDYVRSRRYHAQKLILVWSAMRHFAAELQTAGWPVTYAQSEDFQTPLQNWIAHHQITELQVIQPSDRPFQTLIEALELACPITFLPNNHFLWNREAFTTWAKGYKQLRLENFYRAGRKRWGILMEGDQPIGGQWNLDSENRKPPKTGLNPPEPLAIAPDSITQQVIQDIRDWNLPYFGQLEGFCWAVTRAESLDILTYFITQRLPTFGPYQDAMVTGEDTMWHGLISPYLNLGLLRPLEVIQAVESAYHSQNLSLASVEGFIRQVLGWREYMYGLYHYLSQGGAGHNPAEPDYSQLNWFDHQHPLPDFFWTGKTDLNCLKQVIEQLQRSGYAHHIQRLMILSNFALIAGLNPQAVERWFHDAFIDAYDWVMQPNVIGMGLFADGGKLASKPYAASANYINRMSDYCDRCAYNPKERLGPTACPFNYFYWDFLARHRDKLKQQGRMSLILGQLDRMDPELLGKLQHQAAAWHKTQ